MSKAEIFLIGLILVLLAVVGFLLFVPDDSGAQAFDSFPSHLSATIDKVSTEGEAIFTQIQIEVSRRTRGFQRQFQNSSSRSGNSEAQDNPLDAPVKPVDNYRQAEENLLEQPIEKLP